ncbi:Probable NreB protein [Alloactinosynnema sp. L-07]|uniref:MFS transporter n=1 Tax=Alloactinosynnema sp. L-07 TaxID=1653480 RepID=UPI00065EFF9F|nr:MFS transporter [Alloactinosynnema sp. L-07]CRK58507.1 Probable NreB protein [Alloactinosynnema sp. L-07]
MPILSDRVYRALFAAQIVSLLGTGLATVALGLLAYDLTGAGAGAVLGGLLAIKMLANIVVAPVAATFTARMDRRVLLVSLDAVRAAVVCVLPWVDAVWQVVALVAVLQVASAAFTPTFQAVIPAVLADQRDYTRALSLSRLAYDLEALVSPVLAAALLTVVGFSWLFVGTAIGFAASAVLVLTTRLPKPAPVPRRLTAGLRAYIRAPSLRAQLGLNLAAAAGGALVLVDTVVIVHGLGRSSADVAIALAVFGLGSMATALALPRLLDHEPPRRMMLAAAGTLPVLLLAAPILITAWPTLLLLWLLIGAMYSAVLTPVGRLIRDTDGDLPALFAAQFALSHTGWLVTYLLVAALPPTTAALVLACVAGLGVRFGSHAWRLPLRSHPETLRARQAIDLV